MYINKTQVRKRVKEAGKRCSKDFLDALEDLVTYQVRGACESRFKTLKTEDIPAIKRWVSECELRREIEKRCANSIERKTLTRGSHKS